jgi:hypothetical protein
VNADHLEIRNNTVEEAWEIPFMTSSGCTDCVITGNRLPCGCFMLDKLENDLRKLKTRREETLAKRILENPCRHKSSVSPLSLIQGDKDRRIKECQASHSSTQVVSYLVVFFVAASIVLSI